LLFILQHMKGIKNIIFDLGGVLLTLDYKKTEAAFTKLGVTQFDQLYNQHKGTSLFNDLETGKISRHSFFDAITDATGISMTQEEITNAWNAMLGRFPEEWLTWLEGVSKCYNIYLYSNTNEIHYDAFIEIFQQQVGNKHFNDFFIKAYYSHTLGARKPDPESFLKIIQEQRLEPSETLFIDDTIGNIEGAKAAGLQTIHLKPPMTVLDLDL
jgi:HAD superfamily hydrolase (TIGR01549 family)